MTTGNIFVDKPPVLRTALGCFDITKMKTLLDMETKEISESGNILDRGRCSKNIFADADRNSQEYTVETFDDGKNYAMPYGFIYVSVPEGNASQKTKIIESENELKSSNTESFGWNTGLNLIVANFSVRHNKTTQNLVDELYKEKLIYARHDYVQTRNALVLDKWNVRLNKDFKSEINRLRTNPDNKHFDDFFKNWGTHYTYATTVGEQGSRVSQISEQNAIKLKESGVNVSTGAAVGVSIPLEEFGIPGSASSNLGLDGGNARSNYKKMSDILGSEVGEAKCLGGSTCTGNHASGSGPFVPIFLDLRPISDLLGPPFFSDIAVNELVALRSKLAQEITDYAWKKEQPRKEPAARFLRISGLRKVACFKKNNPNDPNPDPNRRYRKPDKIPSESCEIKNIQFKAGGQMTAVKEFNEKSAWVLPHPGNMQTKLANNSIVAALSVVADGSIQTAPFSRAETLMDMTYFGRPGSTKACFSVSVGASNIAPFGATIMLRGHVEEVSGEAFLDPSAALPDPQAVNPMCVDPSA